MSLSVESKNSKNIFLSVVFVLLIILMVLGILFLVNNRFSSSKILDNENRENKILSMFPLSKNTVDLYTFSCEIKDIIYNNFILQNNNVVKVSISCTYRDVARKNQEIKIPLVIYNPTNETWLIANRILNDLNLWSDEDFVHYSEEMYYYTQALDNPIYDKPENGNYWKQTNNKPTIDAGDKFVIRIASEDSTIYSTKTDYNFDIMESAQFNKEYIKNQYGFDKMNEFIKTGDPKILNLEYDNLLIPNFTEYIEDINPQ